MPSYSHVNFDQIDPSSESEEFEARFGRSHIDSRDLGVSRFRWGPDYRSPVAHRHREQEEAYVVTAGGGRALLDGEIVELSEGDLLRVAPEVVRAFEGGPEGLELIAIGGPKPEGGDGERADVVWPD